MSKWDKIDKNIQDYLVEWYNVVDPDNEDKELLAELHLEGRFRAWDCPECGARCLVGDPNNWDNFQGAWQSETLGDLCMDCASTYLRLKEYAEF